MSKNNSTSISQRKITFDDDDDVVMQPPSKKPNTLLETMNNSFNSMNISESSIKPNQTFPQRECTDFFCTCDSDVKQKFGCKFYGQHSFLYGKPFPNKFDPYNNGGTYPASMYLSPDFVNNIIHERLNGKHVDKK